MFEDEDESVRPLRAPRLPKELHAKLFTTFQEAEHLRYPGGEVFSQLENAISDYVTVRNPLDRRARMLMIVGNPGKGANDPIQNYQIRCETKLIPEEFRCSSGLRAAMFARPMPLRPGYRCVLVTLEPGATEQISPHWLSVWRMVKDGIVVAGQFPQIEVVDEEEPPMLHECFADAMPATTALNPDRYRARP